MNSFHIVCGNIHVCFYSGDEHDTNMTDFDNAVYFTGGATTATAVNNTRDDEVQPSWRFLLVKCLGDGLRQK